MDEKRRHELELGGDHGLPEAPPDPQYTPGVTVIPRVWQCPYVYHDLSFIQAMSMPPGSYTARIGSLDDLMGRDKQREEDGFPRKIRIGRLVKPGRGGKDKVVVVPKDDESDSEVALAVAEQVRADIAEEQGREETAKK